MMLSNIIEISIYDENKVPIVPSNNASLSYNTPAEPLENTTTKEYACLHYDPAQDKVVANDGCQIEAGVSATGSPFLTCICTHMTMFSIGQIDLTSPIVDNSTNITNTTNGTTNGTNINNTIPVNNNTINNTEAELPIITI